MIAKLLYSLEAVDQDLESTWINEVLWMGSRSGRTNRSLGGSEIESRELTHKSVIILCIQRVVHGFGQRRIGCQLLSAIIVQHASPMSLRPLPSSLRFCLGFDAGLRLPAHSKPTSVSAYRSPPPLSEFCRICSGLLKHSPASP